MSFEANYRNIAFSRRGRVLTATIDRAASLNAVDAGLHGELARLFGDLQRDELSDVVVLTGAGRAFCAGGDLDWMQRAIDDPALFDAIAVEAREIVFGQLDLQKPLICGLNGSAIGLGATLALLCDVIIAARSAKIGDPHVKVGLAAGDGGALIWPLLCGYAKAKPALLTGDLVSADEAERIGLVTSVVDDERLKESVEAFADRLASGAVKAARWTKMAMNLPLKALFHDYFETGAAYEILSSRTEEHRNAVAAFRTARVKP